MECKKREFANVPFLSSQKSRIYLTFIFYPLELRRFNPHPLCAHLLQAPERQWQIKFRVRSENYAGGDSVHIDYTDGVKLAEVEKICGKYQAGKFDGMTDSYDYSNTSDNIPQSKYIFVSRKLSAERKQEIIQGTVKRYQMSNWSNEE